MSLKVSQIQLLTAELAALECLKIPHKFYNWKSGVVTFSRLFLIGSISYLQVTMTYTRAWMTLKFGQIRRLVSIATDRVILEKNGVATFSRLFLSDPFHILAANDDMHESSEAFGEIQSGTTELAALEHRKIYVAHFSGFTVVVIPGK